MTEIESLRATEKRSQRAQLSSDLDELDLLLHPELVFAGPDGSIGDKATDLDAHRTGLVRIDSIDEEDLIVRVASGVGIVILTARMAGEFAQQGFDARMRYARSWALGAQGWQLIAAHISMLEP